MSGWLLSARGRKPRFAGPIRRSPIPASPAARLWARGQLARAPNDRWRGRCRARRELPRPTRRHQRGDHPDLTPLTRPDLVEPTVAAKAPAIRRILDSDAWIHTSSKAVAAELADLGRTERVRVIHHGLRPPAPTEPGTGAQGRRPRPGVLVLGTERRKRIPGDRLGMAASTMTSDS